MEPSYRIRKYEAGDIPAMTRIWNRVVEDGEAFPQDTPLTEREAEKFFAEQTETAVCVCDGGRLAGLYILHPNNVGRCGHICNASYAVEASMRGKGVGKALVSACIASAPSYGYRILQFNAVAADNAAALALYRKLGFTQLGVIPGGFHKKDGSYADIIPHYIALTKSE